MSGEAVKRKGKYGKGKGKKHMLDEHTETNGVTPGGKHEKADVGGAGLCTKLSFAILFLSFALTTTLFMLDYKEGQLAQVASTLPPEVQELVKKANVAAAALNENIKKIIAEALIKAEELSKKVPIGGDTTLADIVFNSMEKTRKAAAEEAAAAEAIRIAYEEAAAAEARQIAVEEAAKKAAAAEAVRIAAEEATADEEAVRVASKKAALEKAMAEKAAAKKVAIERTWAEEKAAVEKAAFVKAAENEARIASEQAMATAMAEKAAAKKASMEKALAKKAAEVEAKFVSEQAKLKVESKAVAEAEASANRKAYEAAASKKVEEELNIDKINAEIEAAGKEEAQQKFDEAKKRLEESGVEFVSNDEFAKVKAAKSSKAAGAA
eukprot:GFUD01042349.1.p1 GENE.GFUD01042349.1~~GFUD01042349.1.p1  ORF type:complete len:381 (+),score=161.82 GFUD01042349.1:431-1573(+)